MEQERRDIIRFPVERTGASLEKKGQAKPRQESGKDNPPASSRDNIIPIYPSRHYFTSDKYEPFTLNLHPDDETVDRMLQEGCSTQEEAVQQKQKSAMYRRWTDLGEMFERGFITGV